MGIPYAEVIGDPIAHSKSPLIHKFWLEKLALAGDYRATAVRAGDLSQYLAERRLDPDWRGCSVTLPHKQQILPLLDRLEDDGIGAVNCVLPCREGLSGLNTDKIAVERVLNGAFNRGVEITAPLCLIGAGGAALAALAALSGRSLTRVNLIVRDAARSERPLSRFGMTGVVHPFGDARKAMTGALGLINATPLGMTGAPAMPDSILAGIDALHEDAFVLDMVYAPVWTVLLARAAEAGLETVDGLDMLIVQAERAFLHFYGQVPPGQHEPELRELLLR